MQRQLDEKRKEEARKIVEALVVEYWDNNPSAGGEVVNRYILNYLRTEPGMGAPEYLDAVRSGRTYDRMKVKLRKDQPKASKPGKPQPQREPSLYYEWPASHETQRFPLPWEAARVAGDIQEFYDRLLDGYETAVQMGHTGPPYVKKLTNGQVLWAYRLRCADPSCPTDWLAHASEIMALDRLTNGVVIAGARPGTRHLLMNHERRIQMELRFKVWTPEGKARYDAQAVIAGNYAP